MKRPPMRYVVALLASLAVIICYAQRNVYDVALFEIRRSQLVDRDGYICSRSVMGNATRVEPPMHWSELSEIIILPMYHFGYALSSLPAGYAADKWGARWPIICCVGVSSFLTNLLAWTLTRFGVQCVLRLFIGLAHGALCPSAVGLLRHWAVVGERAAVGAFVFAADYIGIVLGLVFSSAPEHLALTLYVWGGVGMCWVVFAIAYCFSEPRSHDYISEDELQFFASEPEQPTVTDLKLRSVLRDRGVWAYLVAQWAHDFYVPVVTTFFLSYSRSTLNKPPDYITSIAYFLAHPFAVAAGALSDRLTGRHNVRKNIARKLYAALSALFPFGFTTLMEYFTCEENIHVLILAPTTMTLALYSCSAQINGLDLSAGHPALLAGLAGVGGALAAVASHYVAIFIFLENTIYYWNLTYNFYNVAHTAAIVVFVVLASTNRSEWDVAVEDRPPRAVSREADVGKRKKKIVRIRSQPTAFEAEEPPV